MKGYPKPNLKELPGLYAELDEYVKLAERAIRSLPPRLYEPKSKIISFGKMTVDDFENLISRDPGTMVIVLTRVCGLSDREFSRLYQLENVYKLRKTWNSDSDARATFVSAVKGLLPDKMYLETLLFTFYKMWEEHQRRHHRARFEKDVRKFYQAQGYECVKITRPTEVDGAIPATNPRVVLQIRTGVRKDLVKRVKEFSSEFDRSTAVFPDAKFMVVFKIPLHELSKRDEIRKLITDERRGKRPYDAVLLQDELPSSINLLEEWKVPKTGKPQSLLASEDVNGEERNAS